MRSVGLLDYDKFTGSMVAEVAIQGSESRPTVAPPKFKFSDGPVPREKGSHMLPRCLMRPYDSQMSYVITAGGQLQTYAT